MCNDKVILEKLRGQLLILYNVGLVKKKMGEQLGECWDEKGVKKNLKKIKNLPLRVPPQMRGCILYPESFVIIVLKNLLYM